MTAAAGPPPTGEVRYQVATSLSGAVRRFMEREWQRADRRLFGCEVSWTSHQVVVEAYQGRQLVGVAAGEVVAGMARLNDLIVLEERQGQGVGGNLAERFCQRAAELGARRCFLRCPDTERHRRFYERHGFAAVAVLPGYYHGLDFVEYVRVLA